MATGSTAATSRTSTKFSPPGGLMLISPARNCSTSRVEDRRSSPGPSSRLGFTVTSSMTWPQPRRAVSSW
jgi:hypothetical protein